jgi:uridine phosphorylase
VATELDALANVDFATRRVRPEHRRLTLVRLGTSGALQDDVTLGDLILAQTSVGLDGVLNFYAGRDAVCDLRAEEAFVRHTGWGPTLARPYFVDADRELVEAFRGVARVGITASAPGFYAPQGRHVRLAPADEGLNERIASFDHGGLRVVNYEMESAPLAGLARLLGHRAATLCTAIAQRRRLDARSDYRPFVEKMIKTLLDILVEISEKQSIFAR